MAFTALFDACVLYPAPLRDLLMSLAMEDIFRARWTEQIHDEWIRNVLANRPDLNPEQLERTRQLMNAHVDDCLIIGFESLIPSLMLPDPDDRHVLAAAITGRCDVIVTFNQKDFPNSALKTFGIESQDPDSFLLYQLDLSPGKFLNAIRKHRARLKNPPMNQEQYLETLLRQGLTQLNQALKEYSQQF
ncbi:MAG: PIN domain-containing protein [Candidatus Sericytochromatia bacterium]